MGAQTKAIQDKLLTNTSNMYVPEGYISEQVLTRLKVKNTTGKLGRFTNQHLRIQQTLMTGVGMARRVEVIRRVTDSYEVERHGLEEILSKDDFANVEKPFDARKDSTTGLTTSIWLGKEDALASVLTDPTVITQGDTLVGADQYSDFANSDPIDDFSLARETVRAGCGMPPDTALMDWAVMNRLIFHPAILRALGFADNRAGQLSVPELAKAMGVKRLLIAMPLLNAAAEGQPDSLQSVWGKDILFGVLPLTPQVRQLTLGYYVTLTGETPRQVFRATLHNPPESESVIVRDSYDMLISKPECGYLIQDAIA